MQLDIINLQGKVVDKISLNKDVFDIAPRADILHRVVQYQLANRRAGTHSTKTISELSGTTRKPFKQKGTGRARQGSLRSPHMRGGAIIFGPVVRSHEIDLPKKIRALGLKMALSSKVLDKNIIILDSEKLKEPKSASLLKSLKALNINNALFVGADKFDENFQKAVSNIKLIDILPTIGLNVYDILNHETLVLTKDAVQKIYDRLGA